MKTDNSAYSTRKIIFIGGITAVSVILWRELWKSLLPFLLALLVCMPIRRLAKKISSKTGLNLKLCSVICLVFTLTVLLFLMKIGLSLICGEILSLYDRLIRDPQMISDFFEGLGQKISDTGGIFSIFDSLSRSEELSEFAEDIKLWFSGAIKHAVMYLGEKISGVALNTATKIPSAILFFIVFFSSCFYFCCDDGKISDFFIKLLPSDAKDCLPRLKSNIKEVIFGYVKASALLCLMTFFIVLVGLLCIGCKYAMLMSLIIAITDLLPLLGTGVILLPWSLLCFLWADVRTGVALAVIWIIASVVRQIAEPKLIGKRIGLHPLATLAAVYIGAKLAGFAGIVAGPLVAVGIKVILPMLTEESGK